MDRRALEAQVAAHRFLIGMSAHHISLLADCAMATRFPAGQMIFHAGEHANRFYVFNAVRLRLSVSLSGVGAQVWRWQTAISGEK
jgi:CRP-like cAMP-binding protein